jgi:acetylornithine/N-succinyldiaminopimelate aminotransferase
VLDVILAPGFLPDVARKGELLWQELGRVVADTPEVFADVRGAGLILGMKCLVPNTEVQDAFTAEGLLTVAAGDNVIRLVPPLVITDADITDAVAMMRRGARRCLPASSKVAAK